EVERLSDEVARDRAVENRRMQCVNTGRSVVEDFVTGNTGHSAGDVTLRVVAVGVIGRCARRQVWRAGRARQAEISSARDSDADLRAWLAVCVVIICEGELGHGIAAALPLGRPLGKEVGEKDPQPAFLSRPRLAFFAYSVEDLGDGVGPVLPLAAVQGI